MKNVKFSSAQIMAILRQAKTGVPVSVVLREHRSTSSRQNQKLPEPQNWPRNGVQADDVSTNQMA
jgi:hypothetical protein